jgi:hypothetical protein
VDFSTVSVPRRPDGSFIQPCYAPLKALAPWLTSDQLKRERAARRAILTNEVHRYYRVECGDDITSFIYPAEFMKRTAHLRVAYGLNPDVSVMGLRTLLVEGLLDYDPSLTVGDAMACANLPVEDFRKRFQHPT